MNTQPSSLPYFLRELADLESLTRVTKPPYNIVHESTYDRRSISPDDPEGWLVNQDRCRYIRKEIKQGREVYVIADFRGPGCLCRLWTADRRIMPREDLRMPEEATVRDMAYSTACFWYARSKATSNQSKDPSLVKESLLHILEFESLNQQPRSKL